MRVARGVAMAAVLGLTGAAWGQSEVQDRALEHGPLVVWWVAKASAAERQMLEYRKQSEQVLPPRVSVEKTMGEFGTASSNVGQTAGSYGQTSSSTGTASSNVGQTAGSVGQTAGGFGQTSSSVGQTAGSYGQMSSSYGQTASSYGESTTQASVPKPPPGSMAKARAMSAQERDLVDAVKVSSPGLEARFVTVLDVELKERLQRAAGTADAPDVVVGAESLSWWKESQMGMTMLGIPYGQGADGGLNDTAEQHLERTVTILRSAPHMVQAKAFVVWVRDERACGTCARPGLEGVPGEVLSVAKGAVQRVLSGGVLGGDADAAAAKFDPARAQWMALAASAKVVPSEVEGVELEVRPVAAAVSGRMAVVSVRSVASGQRSFGVAHSLVVLRKMDGEAWKVLQVSPNMWPSRMGRDEGLLAGAIAGKGGDLKLQGISLASPVDGDGRPAMPELWWDNKGGGTLEAVEWQMQTGGGWSDSGMELVQDADSRLHTRLVARFATQPTVYRWRVWAVAAGGQLVLSPWRTFTVTG